jgi:hypothetical protein
MRSSRCNCNVTGRCRDEPTKLVEYVRFLFQDNLNSRTGSLYRIGPESSLPVCTTAYVSSPRRSSDCLSARPRPPFIFLSPLSHDWGLRDYSPLCFIRQTTGLLIQRGLSLCWRLLIVPLLQACSRAWLRAGRDAACWVTLTPRSSRSVTSSVASGGLSHHPFIQGVTIPLDNGHVYL